MCFSHLWLIYLNSKENQFCFVYHFPRSSVVFFSTHLSIISIEFLFSFYHRLIYFCFQTDFNVLFEFSCKIFVRLLQIWRLTVHSKIFVLLNMSILCCYFSYFFFVLVLLTFGIMLLVVSFIFFFSSKQKSVTNSQFIESISVN